MSSTSFKKTKRIAVSSLLAALSFVTLYLGALSGIFDLCAIVVGALCVTFAKIEMGHLYPHSIALVTFALAFLLLPDKLVALEYLFLGGLYPILKSFAERKQRKRGRVVGWTIKLGYFNIVMFLFLILAKFVITTNDSFIITGTAHGVAIAVFGIANACFIFYDYAMSKFISYYVHILRKKLKIRGIR